MKKTFILCFLLWSIAACSSDDKKGETQSGKEEHTHQHDAGYDSAHKGLFDDYGISFSIPKDWAILDGEIPGGGQYVSVEKSGTDESGRYSISILPGDMTLESLLETVKKQFREGMKPTGNEVLFTENRKELYNNIEAISCRHSFTNQGLEFEGEVKVMNCNDNIINIVTIGAKSDITKNQPGFDLIDKTFACK